MIRIATESDLPKLKIMIELLTDMHVKEGLPDNRDAFYAAVKGGIDHVFVMEESGELVGFVAWIPISDSEAVGYGTYVAQDFRRKGISEALRSASKEHLKSIGISIVTGGVAMFNEPAMKAVQKQGFKPVAYVVQLSLED
jgi:GNAT superfamily N-acetyltransferase